MGSVVSEGRRERGRKTTDLVRVYRVVSANDTGLYKRLEELALDRRLSRVAAERTISGRGRREGEENALLASLVPNSVVPNQHRHLLLRQLLSLILPLSTARRWHPLCIPHRRSLCRLLIVATLLPPRPHFLLPLARVPSSPAPGVLLFVPPSPPSAPSSPSSPSSTSSSLVLLPSPSGRWRIRVLRVVRA